MGPCGENNFNIYAKYKHGTIKLMINNHKGNTCWLPQTLLAACWHPPAGKKLDASYMLALAKLAKPKFLVLLALAKLLLAQTFSSLSECCPELRSGTVSQVGMLRG